MIKQWKTVGIFTLLTIYIIMGVTMLRKKPQKSLKPDYRRIKTLVGYSWEYKIAEDLNEKLVCEEELYTEFNEFVPDDSSANLEFDENLGLYTIRAFFDQRLTPFNYVRIIALVPENAILFCQIWFENNGQSNHTGLPRRANITPIWSKNWGGQPQQHLIPSLISCLIPPNIKKKPKMVSVTTTPCQMRNRTIQIFKQSDLQSQQSRFTICVKPFNFTFEVADALNDWIRLNLLFGANKIIIYYYNLAKRLRKRLKNPSIELIKFTPKNINFGGSFKEHVWTKRKLEIITYNDCFYRNVYSDFVIPLDIDELIVPKKGSTWEEMFSNHFGADVDKVISSYSSFSVRNVYFFSQYPSQALEMLPTNESHLVDGPKFFRQIRSLRFSPKGESTKSFIYSPNTLTIFNHFSMHVIGPTLRQYFFPIDVVQLNHYRDNCDSRLIDDCGSFLNFVTFDNTLERFYQKIKSI